MKKIAAILLPITMILMPFLSMAHPGHGKMGGYTITHYFTEPEHVIPIFAVTAAALLLLRYPLKRKRFSRD
jgi:hypothetical protein